MDNDVKIIGGKKHRGKWTSVSKTGKSNGAQERVAKNRIGGGDKVSNFDRELSGYFGITRNLNLSGKVYGKKGGMPLRYPGV